MEFVGENCTTEEVYKQALTSVKHQSGANSQLSNSNPASQQAIQQASKPAVSKMQFNSDPHLRRPEEFGVEGMTVKVGNKKLVACTVIGAPSHRSCPFYYKSQVN